MRMKKYQCLLFLLTVALGATGIRAQEERYSPLSEYLMSQEDEIALAKSAAPQAISDHATIRVFTSSGYQNVHEGDNGFVCMVMRGFTGAPTFTPLQVRIFVNYDPKTRAPICLNPAAVRTVLPYYELRTKLGLEGKTAEQIAAGVEAAYAKGEIPKRTEVSFAYMWSADQVLGPAGHWHPHMMVYLPYYDNSMLGNNDPGVIFQPLETMLEHHLRLGLSPWTTNWQERHGPNRAWSTCSIEIPHRSARVLLAAAPQVPA